jgi:DNA polymerase-3 subunit gamma/tau
LKIETGAVAVLARAAEGSLRDGLSLLEQAISYADDEITDAQVRELLGVVAESVLDELVESIATQSAERALGLVHRLIGDGQNLQHFCREAIRHFRNLMVARVCGAESDLVAAPADERPRLAAQAAKFSEEDLTRFFQILLLTDDDLRRKPDPRLHLELGLLKLVNAQRLAPLEEVLAELRGELRGESRSERSAEPKTSRTALDSTGAPPRAMSAAQSSSGFSSGASAATATAPARTDAPEPPEATVPPARPVSNLSTTPAPIPAPFQLRSAMPPMPAPLPARIAMRSTS